MMKLSEKIIQKYGVVGSRASWEKLREWSAEAAQLEEELELERKTVTFLDAEFDIKQRLVIAEKENAELKQGLQQISAMRTWAGRWTQEELETTSHQRLIACYDVADALLKGAEDEAE